MNLYNTKSSAEAELLYMRSKLSLGVLAILFDIVNIVEIRVISCVYRVISCDIVNIVSIVA